jgi:lipopolysaccharide export system permease protein
MLKLLDRMLVRNYMKAYLICLVSLLSLFIVVDLFTNLDDFTQGHKDFWSVAKHIGLYYTYKTAQVFDRLCEAIILMAAMFTVAWIQRNNELLPVLSAGVSTRRMVRAVLLCACAMVGLAILNQELVLPHVDNYVIENRRDPDGKHDIPANGAFDLSNGTFIKGEWANRAMLSVKGFVCVIPDKNSRDSITRMEAREARYVPPGDGPNTGGWLLIGTKPDNLEDAPCPSNLKKLVNGKFFLKTLEVDFEALTRQRNWWMFRDTYALYQEMYKTDPQHLAGVAVLFHMRLTRPALGMILVLLGLSVILRDQNRNVFISTGLCLMLCAVFFLAGFFCKHLGDHEYLSPALAAWLPVLAFGPLSFVMFDAIHT